MEHLLKTEFEDRAKRLLEKDSYDFNDLEELVSLPEYRKAEVILSYYSYGSEADTRQLIDRALRDGKRVYLPRVLSKTQMQFYLYEQGTLVKSPFLTILWTWCLLHTPW